jgi:protein gp37
MAKAARASDLRGRRRDEDKAWLNGLPRLWFVSDMGDALSKTIDFPYLRAEIVDVVREPAGRRHRWMWLTKQPKRMLEFASWLREKGADWPSNLWPGTSITEPRSVDRIDYLRQIGDDHAVRFLSVEPQHKSVSLESKLTGISLVIQGGESGPTKASAKSSLEVFNQRRARPFDLAWARSLRDECRHASVAFFLKQLGSAPVENGKPLKLRDGHGGDWDEWPEDLRIREMPIL